MRWLPPDQGLSQKRLRSLVLLLLALGIFFRWFNLDGKIYWYDEVMTSLRLSGNTLAQLTQDVFNGRILTVQELHLQYQYPNSAKDLADTIYALSGNAEHSPLYFLLARFWLQAFGHSIAVIRSLSALISLLVFPCLYWLAMELFASRVVAGIAVALVAISPFHVLYAQEARAYSFWTVTILLSTACLLWAMRQRNRLSWGIYTIATALGLYVHPFSALVATGHGIYVVLLDWLPEHAGKQDSWQVGTTLRAKQWWLSFIQSFTNTAYYLLASLVAVLLFVPWLRVVIANFDRAVQNTISTSRPLPDLPQFWLLNLSRVFFDLNHGPSLINPVMYLIAALAIYALVVLCRQTPPRTWLLIMTLISVTGLAMIGPDLLLGGRRSYIPRYAIPCYLGIQLAVAYLLAQKLTSKTTSPSYQRWRGIAIALVLSGVLSCAVSSQARMWWHKSYAKSRHDPTAARIINQHRRPLVISDEIPGRVLSFTHSLQPQVQLQLLPRAQTAPIPRDFEPIFLYRPSDQLRRGLEQQNWQVEPVYKAWLWQLKAREKGKTSEY
jgi:uncharacterized membrane protein